MQGPARPYCLFPMRLRLPSLLILLALVLASPAPAQDAAPRPLPRFEVLTSNLINARRGPGPDYGIDHVYRRAGLPVEVVEQHQNHSRIVDIDGKGGWVPNDFLRGDRHVMLRDPEAILPLKATADEGGRDVALLKGRVIGGLLGCTGAWCEIQIPDPRVTGWVPRNLVWGLLAFEQEQDFTLEPGR